MLRKATIGLTTLAIATTTAIAPAMADNTITSETVPADAIATTETAPEPETAPEQETTPEQETNSSKLNKDDIHNKLDALSSKIEDFNVNYDKFVKTIDFDKIQDALKVVEKIIIIAGKLA